MGVKITYLNENQTGYIVDWGGRRVFTYEMPHTELTPVQFSLLTLAYEETLEKVDRKTLAKLDSEKVYKLVERLATEFCVAYSPTTGAGLQKKYIRHVILQALQELQGTL
ncbi:hypothetical protein [Rossellomorea aquimaris]|uniref:hypothetical protein n=1 Tax=Rossellomorea aquimaris TaxID=189382 RepID=UPI0011E920D0|nr:hypothetical protein [Rossellomorea aquimaris]TYS88971.1 hypothetical protein FZC88_12970 [Rossellomorea aquimaris]